MLETKTVTKRAPAYFAAQRRYDLFIGATRALERGS
jgi:hypothetical protein